MSDAFPEPKVRRLRASSRAVTTFIAGVANTAGDIPAGKAVRVRITGVQLVKIGRGTSVDLSFEVMPRDEWPDLASFDRDPGGPSTTPSSASGDGERDELF
ncbi:hypothetical protein M1105_19185 [Limibaculum sp. FT325]|uniref:hypothetical protein n=1 Tax=Thermohalobaculum sediminis TaxID=2939436 RepID=UPI0020BEAB0E|nr:hypothetical protein [Limibaculum sediminis]MCL5779092.1 hypothetical protein [Limibaculum sediminis]